MPSMRERESLRSVSGDECLEFGVLVRASRFVWEMEVEVVNEFKASDAPHILEALRKASASARSSVARESLLRAASSVDEKDDGDDRREKRHDQSQKQDARMSGVRAHNKVQHSPDTHDYKRLAKVLA